MYTLHKKILLYAAVIVKIAPNPFVGLIVNYVTNINLLQSKLHWRSFIPCFDILIYFNKFS